MSDTSRTQTDAENVSENAENVFIEQKKRRHKKLHEITALNDIKYRGPFSYRHLRIFAWVFMAMAQVGFFLSAASNIDKQFGEEIAGLSQFFKSFGSLTLPLFLIASFAVILHAKDGYKNLILLYTFGCLGCILAFIVVYNHYIVGILALLTDDGSEASMTASNFIYVISGNGFISFNIFIDLLQFTLFTFFVNYHPVKHFKGKKMIIFRLFAIIPIMYEAASITLKILSALNCVVLPVYVFPFLTTKPPAVFILFLALTFFIKTRERIFKKRNRTLSEYKAFLKTNANSLHFSVYTCIIIVVSVIVDFIVLILVASFIFVYNGGGENILLEAFTTANKLGFGESLGLLLIIPFVLLFSYTKTYKDNMIDKFIPFGGVALIAMVYVEGAFRLLELVL